MFSVNTDMSEESIDIVSLTITRTTFGNSSNVIVHPIPIHANPVTFAITSKVDDLYIKACIL
jgi:hypothetical protein